MKESFSVKVLSFITILVTATVFYPTGVMAATILSESFGTGSTGSISGWTDGGISGDDSEARASSSGNDSASPDGGRFAVIFGDSGYICKSISTVGYTNVQLSYNWRGDSDAGSSSDDGIVEFKTSGDCDDSSGWTQLQNHDMQNDSSWSTQGAFTNAGMNNATILLRFRTDTNDSDEHFRVDGISLTGDAGDTTAPTVTNVTSSTANGSYNAGDVVNVQVTFSETVLVTGTPRITLETGATDRNVNYTSGSNSSTLVFAYTVQAGDTSSDLNYTTTSALALNGGTIKDAATNNATLTLPSTGAGNSLGGNKNIVIDTTAPTIAQVTPVPALTNDSTPNYTFSSNEAGTITYAGGCTSGTANATASNNTVTFASLADGTYGSCTVKVTDAAGNQSNTLSVSSFDIDTTPPVITVLGDNPLELGTGDTFTDPGATANDAHDGSVTVNTAHSVNTAVPNTYAVSYSATDAAGNTSNASRSVEVSDDDGPEFFGMPMDMIIEALDMAGAIVSYVMPTAVDNVDGDVSASIVCTPSSGSTFPFGNTVVGCLVSDTAGNDTSDSFNVLVQDTTVPTLAVIPGDQTLEAVDASGAVATFSVTAADNINGDVSASIVCDALSGNTFALGVTTVTCTAEDGAGNMGATQFTITVQDTIAPVIEIDPAAGISITTVDSAGAVIHFSPTATDAVDADPSISCDATSGAMLPIGAWTVTCTATDDSGNSASDSIVVSIVHSNPNGGSTDAPVSTNSGSSDVPPPPPSSTSDDTTSDIGEAVAEGVEAEVEGEVAGAACVVLTSYIGRGANNADDVTFLQEFLNKEMGLSLEVNGIFDDATKEAVKAFQLKYADEILKPWGITKPTGIVYKTTQRMINKLSCPGTDIPMPELN